MISIELNIDGKDMLSVKIKNGIQFDGIVTQVSASSDDFIIRGKLKKEEKDEAAN